VNGDASSLCGDEYSITRARTVGRFESSVSALVWSHDHASISHHDIESSMVLRLLRVYLLTVSRLHGQSIVKTLEKAGTY